MAIYYGYYSSHNKNCKEGENNLAKDEGLDMIHYAPLWKTLAAQKKTTYTLRVKYGMSHATVQRLQADLPVSTHTLDKLCRILDCRLQDVAEYLPDEEAATVSAPGK